MNMSSLATGETWRDGSVQRVSPPQETVEMAELLQLWQQQDKYVDMLEARLAEMEELEKNKAVTVDTSRRENLLVMRLTAKEQELQEMAAQIAELKSAQAPTNQQVKSEGTHFWVIHPGQPPTKCSKARA